MSKIVSPLNKILLIPDTHAPYHDKRAFDLMLSVARDFSPDTLVILGDFYDFYAVSSHSKSPNRERLLSWEIEIGNKLLDELCDLGATKKIFIAGNHENRLERYIAERAPELFQLLSIPDLFKLKERGFEWVPYRSDIKIGELYLTHDCGNAGRYAAFKAMDTYQGSIVIGHTHRMSFVVEGSADGKKHLSATLGWLGDELQADYMHRVKAARDWSLGFGVGYQDETGQVYLQPIPIIDYACVLNGKLYKG